MHGPQAFARTVAPIASRSARRPSLSIVARTCSDPGVTNKGIFDFNPLERASRAIPAALVISS